MELNGDLMDLKVYTDGFWLLVYGMFSNFSFGAPQIGQVSGGSCSAMCPQIVQM